MKEGDFQQRFNQLTGNLPFPWQAELFKLLQRGPEFIPARCDIPTGLGKTSVIALWLLARDINPDLPRRLVYIVNRRTVVDQTTAEVEKYREARPTLALSTLRGQFADNREWSADPSREAVICGTVDMIGSRLLFSGYGVGFRGKPLHAGFLGQDALIVHDEAHLEPALQSLLAAIEREQRHGRSPDRRPIRVMELSATSRGNGPVFGLTEDEKQPDFEKAGAPEQLRIVWKRTHATKLLKLHPVPEEKNVADKLAELALAHSESGRAILVFVRTVDDLAKVVAKLPGDRTRQLTGTMRGFEREELIAGLIFKRFLPNGSPSRQTVYLVCTSAGEVGVNISADHLVCDLTTFESMAQRFGRVNRFGLRDDTRVDVVYPATFDKKSLLTPPREKTLKLLERLNGNASPSALGGLDPVARANAFAPLPEILEPTDILFDAWSMTSIVGFMPGRPPVEPYLHGVSDYEPPETQVAWREEVGVIVGELLDEYPPGTLLDEYPVKPHETLRDRTDRVLRELLKIASRSPSRPIWVVNEFGDVDVIDALATLTTDDSKRVAQRLAGKLVLLPHDIGGLSERGTLSAEALPVAGAADVADRPSDGAKPTRVRLWRDDPEFDSRSVGMREILRIDLPPPDDDEDGGPNSWYWLETPQPKDNSKHAVEPLLLEVHVNDVEERARAIMDRLAENPGVVAAVRIAASFHDLGKRREIWQRSIGRPRELSHIWFGKSGLRWKDQEITRYRHEFGSLIDLEKEPDFQSLDDDSRELVQHLIAAHHGMGRPHFTAEQIIDPNTPVADCEIAAIEVSRRFARLQRKYGRWGLAYLESLLRAADWAASAHPTSTFKGAME